MPVRRVLCAWGPRLRWRVRPGWLSSSLSPRDERRSLNARRENQPGHTLGRRRDVRQESDRSVRLVFLLAARAPGIYLYVKVLAVLGQCALRRLLVPHLKCGDCETFMSE